MIERKAELSQAEDRRRARMVYIKNLRLKIRELESINQELKDRNAVLKTFILDQGLEVPPSGDLFPRNNSGVMYTRDEFIEYVVLYKENILEEMEKLVNLFKSEKNNVHQLEVLKKQEIDNVADATLISDEIY